MPDSAPIRYAIYTRQSKLGLFDFSSCDAQFQTCQAFAKQSGEPLFYRAGRHFKDEGFSGSSLLNETLAECRRLGRLEAADLSLEAEIGREVMRHTVRNDGVVGQIASSLKPSS